MNDLTLVHLLEPPIIAVSAREGMTIAVDADGTVTIVIGPEATPAPALDVPWHMVRCLGLTLLRIAESADGR